jgi:hypothetical protein
MAELKTQKNDGDVAAFLEGIEDPTRRRDAIRVSEMMARISGEKPSMWGSSIVGFGDYSYPSASKKENTWFKIGLSPRKQSLTLYLMDGFDGYRDLLGRLGPHSTGRACLYIKDMDKVDAAVVEELIESSLSHLDALSSRS